MQRELYNTLTDEQKDKFKIAIQRGYLNNYDKDWKYTFVGAFLTNSPRRVKILDDYLYEFDKFPVWEDMTDRNLKVWKEIIQSHMCAASCKTIFAEIKAVINDFRNEVEIPTKRYMEILKSKGEPSQAVYLTRHEIDRINEYKPTSLTQRYVKKVFMIQCLTGARISDAERLTVNNVSEDSITYVSQKTKVKTSMPVHSLLMPYLEDTTQLTPCIDLFNDTIRTICQICGIDSKITIFRRGKETTEKKYNFVSSHTARRSFATNLFLKGADILTISRLMGHTSVDNTQRYIVGFRQMDQKVMSFFK